MDQINILLVFMEGIISFFSPCILPILPVYISILSSSSGTELNEITKRNFSKSTLLKNTIMFVLGIASTFFILGSTISLFNDFFMENKQLIMIIGGMLIIIMGAFYMGIINISFMQKEKKLHVNVKEMKPITAFILGFTFSFGWTPCLGPMIASVLIMASGAESKVAGNLLILIYTIGFTLPFIVISLFYNKLINVLDKVKKHMGTIQKIGGLILIISGLIMMIGGVKTPLNYSKDNNITKVEGEKEIEEKEINETEETDEIDETDEPQGIKAPDFTLVDQYGQTHTLSEYEGKVVFLNFWATWCPPCKAEMPHIEEIYNQYNKNSEEVIILGVAAPNVGKEKSKEFIIEFLEKNEYTFPVVFDNTVEIMQEYYIEAFPSTFIIDRGGNVVKYIPGAMDKNTMEQLIEDTLARVK